MKALVCAVIATVLCWACSSNPKLAKKSVSRDSLHTEIPDITLNTLFRGRHSTLIDSLGWYRCGGIAIQAVHGDVREFAIEQISPSRSECSNGEVRILFTRLLYRTPYGKPVSLILDELTVRSDADNYYSYATCKQKEKEPYETLLIHYRTSKKADRAEIIEMWRVDPENNSFIKITTLSMFECIEEEVCIDEEMM